LETFKRPVLVVKVGTSTLTDRHGNLDRSFLIDLTSQLAERQQSGFDVILVTSGAIRAGREALAARTQGEPAEPSHSPLLADPNSLPFKQAAAAIGQGRLMHTYTEAFSWRNTACAQVLLTRDDIEDPRRLDNARNTLLTLLSLRVIPIINENDTVAVDEIKFGDNDNLAAMVARLIGADILLILSDVEGLYSHAGPRSADEQPISVVERVDAVIQAMAGSETSQGGTGGMRTKIEAARIATEAGIKTVIARGRRPMVIRDAISDMGIGTLFLPQTP
jgi:glutamate 5-kinase